MTRLDPIALAVLQHFVTPGLREFTATRPDASREDRSAAASLIMSVGVLLIRMARLKSGLDTVRQLPDTTGTFLKDYEFLSTPKDTPEARTAVAEELSSGPSSGPSSDAQVSSAPPARDVSERWPGQYL